MTETMQTIGALALGTLFFAVFTAVFLILNEDRLPKLERFLRRRAAGAALMLLALAWCIPQIRAVAWSALGPWLWPLAAAATLAAYFYLDNVLPRAVAGLLIMGAYTFLNFSFADRLATGVYGAVLAWFWGTAGIAVAAKPCWMRDFFRLCVRNKAWRYGAAAATCGTALFGILVVILVAGGR